MNSNLLHEALESNFNYMPSKYFIGYNPKLFIMPDIKRVDPFSGMELDQKYTDATLLTRQQEKHLFVQYNYQKMCCKELVNKFNISSSRSTAKKLVDTYREVKTIREGITHANVRLIVKFVFKAYENADNTDLHDMISEANFTLQRCIEKFNIDKGFKFSTMVGTSVFRCFSTVYGNGVSKHFSYTKDDAPDIEDKKHYLPTEAAERNDSIAHLRNVLNDKENLEENEFTIISRRYLSEQKATLEEVGKELGISKERIRQIESKALAKLKIRLMTTA